MNAKSPRRLIDRLLRTRRSTSDDTSVSNPRHKRMDQAPPDSSTASEAEAPPPTPTWTDIGAAQVPKSRAHGSEPVQLPESRAEPGGPPVYADPDMVTPEAAEKMRPLFRRSR